MSESELITTPKLIRLVAKEINYTIDEVEDVIKGIYVAASKQLKSGKKVKVADLVIIHPTNKEERKLTGALADKKIVNTVKLRVTVCPSVRKYVNARNS